MLKALSVMALISSLASVALAQELNGHPPQDQEIHRLFYHGWMQPDSPWVSCCSEADCAPAEERFQDGHWIARKVNSGEDWVVIPEAKIETKRDNPDGRPHLCTTRAMAGWSIVLCFIHGTGT